MGLKVTSERERAPVAPFTVVHPWLPVVFMATGKTADRRGVPPDTDEEVELVLALGVADDLDEEVVVVAGLAISLFTALDEVVVDEDLPDEDLLEQERRMRW